MSKFKKKNNIRNKKGNLTVDFLFGITIVFACMAVFFTITFSLSVIEIAQYISYASARTYTAAHISPEIQKERAFAKYSQLMNTGIFKTLLKESDWFSLEYIDARDFRSETEVVTEARDLFVGVELKFTASMMDMSLPLVGDSSENDGFSSKVSSYLGREPSALECTEYYYNRAAMITALGYQIPNGADDVKLVVDNGC